MLLSNDKERAMLEIVMEVIGPAYGHVSRYLLSFTFYRFILAVWLLWAYVAKMTITLLPTILRNLPSLLSSSGRAELVGQADEYREAEQMLADLQFSGDYQFPPDLVYPVSREDKAWMNDRPFSLVVKEISVCGARARYIHIEPKSRTDTSTDAAKRPIVFLHGNPSWSFLWRNVIPDIVDRGHEVYALDWIGHGRSDKILPQNAITFELHMRTLIEFFKKTSFKDATLVAHDWGGCIALCTFPHLPADSVHRLFLLNAFLPPRSSEMKLHYRLLYFIWFFSTGVMGGYLPEAGVMRYMAPKISQHDIEGYSAPYSNLPVSTKASVFRFAHIAPGLPRTVLETWRNSKGWKLLEGLCGPSNFSSVNGQARLAQRDNSVRQFWESANDGASAHDDKTRVIAVFGEDDPLLKSYKDILVRTIHPRFRVDWATTGVWVPNAGHYATEEKPKEIVNLIEQFSLTE